MTDHISDIKGWFEAAVPEPTDKNRAVQIGCHFEEVHEMAELLTADDHIKDMILTLAEYFKKQSRGLTIDWPNDDRLELLDALCDQIVTATGVAHMFGLDIEGALAEVIRSNYSKFVDGKPVFDANGKIAKPATYIPPDLTAFA